MSIPAAPRRYDLLFGLLGLCLAVGGIAGAVTAQNVAHWYHTLHAPGFTPPDAVFGPVWTALYIIMAIAAWRAWRHDDWHWKSSILWIFLFQLALNFAWSFLFFSFHVIGVALIEISLLWCAIALTARRFWIVDRLAGLLLLPYLGWVSYATVLNGGFWQLN